MYLSNSLNFKKIISYGKVVRFPHYETIFKFVFVIILVATVFNFNAIINFIAYAKQNDITIISWSELKIVPAIWAAIYMIKHLTQYLTLDYVTLNLNDKYQGQERQLRIKKSVKWIYDGFHYTATSIFAWYFFHSADWYPTQLGGSGQCQNLYGDYPAFPTGDVAKYLSIFYIIQLAKHSYAMIELIILGKEVEIKFWEYLLHHYVACTLIFFSLSVNIIKLGVVILIIHDISDAFLAIGRGYADFKTSKKALIYILFSLIQISWLYTRMFVFPVCVIAQHNFYMTQVDEKLWNIIEYPMIFQTILLHVLLAMHFYWVCFMVKIGMGIFKQGIYKNVYDNKENKVDEDKSALKQKSH